MAKLIYILRKTYADETIRTIIVCAFTEQARAIKERDIMNGQGSVPKATYCVEAINLYSDTADLDNLIDTNENNNRRRTIDQKQSRHRVEINDDTPVGPKELAEHMQMGVSTIHKYKQLGYEMEFGIRTTAGHFKAWLREYYQKKREAERSFLKAHLYRLT